MELFKDPRHVRQDLKLLRSALNNGWPISEDLRKAAMARIAQIVIKSNDSRELIAAVRTLLSADALNQRRESQEQNHEQQDAIPAHYERIFAIAERLGVASHLGGIERGRTSNNPPDIVDGEVVNDPKEQ